MNFVADLLGCSVHFTYCMPLFVGSFVERDFFIRILFRFCIGLNAFHQSNIKSGAKINQIREIKFGVWESGFGMDFPVESCC
jgi:hypothetical protein